MHGDSQEFHGFNGDKVCVIPKKKDTTRDDSNSNNFYLLKKSTCAVADLHTKVSGAPPPTGPNSFVFTHVFAKKCPCWRLVPPPTRVGAPQREILDPPLVLIRFSGLRTPWAYLLDLHRTPMKITCHFTIQAGETCRVVIS